ncbi:MAG TPA: NADPH-dependent glutamate synthase [Dehalococcoidia bacterium]|nr:NADPH-dependent glutamate synthase [Dehalococcoidia bacterium]
MTPREVTPRDAEIQRRLAISRVPINKQDPETRRRNWDEVFLGFDVESAKVEASRCIQCPTAPCQQACPVGNDIPGAFKLLERGDIAGAANKFRETSNLPELCGRLCPQERLCEGECVVAFAIRPDSHQEPPVSIGKLEAFVTDYQRKNFGVPIPVLPEPSGFRVAIVGAGPAGLAVAEELAKRGHACTLYDAWPEPGGILLYGIPNFKLSKEVLQDKLKYLDRLGVRFVGNTWVGRDITVDDLFAQGFHAVFFGTGAGVGGKLAIPGEELAGIYPATEFLVRGNLRPDQLPESMREPLEVGDDVVVIGGGDTSMDCVRTAVRLGARNVTCIYRRTEAEMLGRTEERQHAREEGVNFQFLTIPLRFIGNAEGHVTGVECQRMELGQPDESGRRRPIPVPHSEFIIPADSVAVAIGYNADPIIKDAAPGVATNRWNLVEVDRETYMTSRPGVFAGGDNVNGADLVVTALADGRRAALAIDEYLQSLVPLGAR